MKTKNSKLSVILIIFMLISSFSVLMSNSAYTTAKSSVIPNTVKKDIFTPTVSKPAWIDQNNNKIADTLDQEIAERTDNGTIKNEIGVTVMLKAEPTTQDVADFVSSGGQVTTSLWTKATYGFGGTITYDGIRVFASKCPDLLLIEKETVDQTSIAYAAQQVGARNYVWNTLGLQGDSNSSTAVLDSGIDASHADFSPGYGDQNFSKKIVGWQDFVNFTSSPFDDNGHGSHVAGLAAGDGFFSVDPSGEALATWGENLTGSSSGTYLISGMMVNTTGSINVTARWLSSGTATVSSISLFYGGKNLDSSSWSQLFAINTFSNNTWYSQSYTVPTTPSGGYDMYHIKTSLTSGTGSLYAMFTMSWPYSPPADNVSAWTGIAPQSKLVGVKTQDSTGGGTSLTLTSGINWVVQNRLAYHITVASISIGFSGENAQVDQAILNMVNSGIATVVAAGNSGSGSNKIYSPGSVDEAITVAAMNQFDNITNYSSQGGTSGYTGKTIKPDITAPGGSFYAVPLFSADSNTNDAGGGFADVQTNDGSPMQGTSMATPIISGCTQLLVQAMGGFANWNFTRTQALQPKMFLLMTATETYPNNRELDTSSSYSPTLQRGGKDVHEGFGRVNLDAAVDAILKSYTVGSVASDTLGRPPTTADISVLGQKLAWARNVQLTSGYTYNFSLSVPTGADYDLYLYNNVGTTFGEPAIISSSTNATNGGIEQFYVTPNSTETYYVVVKRATENTGSGNFTLTSSKSIITTTVRLTTPGIVNASNVVHYIQNGIPQNGSIVAGNFSDLADVGTMLTVDNPIYLSPTQRYSTTQPTSFQVQLNPIVEDLNIENSHPYPNNYNNTWTLTRPNATMIKVHFNYIFTEARYDNVSVMNVTSPTFTHSWSGGPYTAFWTEWFIGDTVKIRLTTDLSGTNYGFLIDQIQWTTPNAANYTTNFKTEYYLSVNSTYGSKSGDGWYQDGTNATAALSNSTIDNLNGTRRIFINWTGDATGSNSNFTDPIFMNASKSVLANWQTQYYLNVSSAYGTVGGGGWYNDSTIAYANVSSSTIPGDTGTQYVFTGWSVNADGATSTSNPITMLGPKIAATTWKTQYLVSFTSTPSNLGSTSPATSMWIDPGTVSISATPNSGYLFSGWSSNTGGITFLSASSTSTTANINGPGTINANFAAAPSPTPAPTPIPTPVPTPVQTSSTTTTSPKPTVSSTPTPLSTTAPPTTSPTATPKIPEIFPSCLLLALIIITGTALFARKKLYK